LFDFLSLDNNSLGATTVIAGRKIDQLTAVANEIKTFGGKVRFLTHKDTFLRSLNNIYIIHLITCSCLQIDYVQMNIRNEESVNQAILTILQRYHKISGLVVIYLLMLMTLARVWYLSLYHSICMN
jgi:NADP-dependent 3-hydroxy acid dehydrogenase YdfG